jgi:hypothetical protein
MPNTTANEITYLRVEDTEAILSDFQRRLKHLRVLLGVKSKSAGAVGDHILLAKSRLYTSLQKLGYRSWLAEIAGVSVRNSGTVYPSG